MSIFYIFIIFSIFHLPSILKRILQAKLAKNIIKNFHSHFPTRFFFHLSLFFFNNSLCFFDCWKNAIILHIIFFYFADSLWKLSGFLDWSKLWSRKEDFEEIVGICRVFKKWPKSWKARFSSKFWKIMGKFFTKKNHQNFPLFSTISKKIKFFVNFGHFLKTVQFPIIFSNSFSVPINFHNSKFSAFLKFLWKPYNSQNIYEKNSSDFGVLRNPLLPLPLKKTSRKNCIWKISNNNFL